MNANMQKMGRALYDMAGEICTQIILGMLWMDRKVIKRYLQLETPLYRLWWKGHVERMDKRLKRERDKHEMGIAVPFVI
jgi:hypothetical protein